jgi:hypothetical protein
MKKRVKVVCPAILVQRNGRDALTMHIGGVPFRLMGDHEDQRVRSIMCALHFAKVTLEVEEDPKFPMPEQSEAS